MKKTDKFVALGLMSGTSADGLDIALIKTDGKNKIILGPSNYYPFTKEFIKKIKRLFTKRIKKNSMKQKNFINLEQEFTKLNINLINQFLKKNKIKKKDIDVIGFHGQTICHNPRQGYSIQIGNAQTLANSLKIKVISNFRLNDIKNGGQGAPLTPIFHYYLTSKLKKKICFINLGGITNITYCDHTNRYGIKNLLAFDVGPCCSLLDDWISLRSQNKFDKFGNLAKKGSINKNILDLYLKNNYFLKKPPKSLDRSFFSITNIRKLSINDGAATLTQLIIKSIRDSLEFLPLKPELFILSGGGRLNKYLVNKLNNQLNSEIKLSDDIKWNGDAIEAYAFGFLAVRRLKNLPISFPQTTGVNKSVLGGDISNSY